VTLKNRLFPPPPTSTPHASPKEAFAVGWSGMRGIVTLAAAIALPAAFPYRDFIQLSAFVVVLGTLVLQGLTLRPLLQLLQLPSDTVVDTEVAVARKAALKAGLTALGDDATPAAERLRQEYAEALGQAKLGGDARDTPDNFLRRRAITASRAAVADLRSTGAIGDTAYRRMEEELDWLDLSAGEGSTY
jgi:CPA1 family monovalent cation:H+ antiporter